MVGEGELLLRLEHSWLFEEIRVRRLSQNWELVYWLFTAIVEGWFKEQEDFWQC